MRRHHIVIPLAALLALSPLLRCGTSCGHDIGFHMQSWVDAAAQLRHGALYPRWAFTPAWQAGEPRFVFYPPLSWMFGALLTLLLPMPATPNAFIFVAMVAAGFSLHTVARRFVSPNAALVAACAYLGNPYMLFNAFERSAYAELLASIWIPLLFLVVLRRRTPIALPAIGIALAWLTNVPSGIMATYTFALLAGARLVFEWHQARHGGPQALVGSSPRTLHDAGVCELASEGHPPVSLRSMAFALAAALVLGVTIPAFYLLPAAVERRYVQSSMVMIENLRYQDNFLFERTSWEPHNVVTHTVSLLAVVLLVATACLIGLLFLGSRSREPDPAVRRSRFALTVLFGLILFLLVPISGWVWRLAPELPFLQFPWRLLTVLSVVMGFALALRLRHWHNRAWLAPVFALAYVASASGIASHLYRQACEIPHMAQYTVDVFRAGHGVPATDEYTPGDADNDVLRTDSPGYWLVSPADPNDAARGTVPNPSGADPNFDGPIPYADTHAEHAPTHLDLTLVRPEILVLNLRDYPGWRVTRNGKPVLQRLHRDDGLTAIPLPAGPSQVDVSWHRGADVYAGNALSLAALAALLWLRSRQPRPARVESTVPAA